MDLSSSVTSVPGIGEAIAKKLSRLGISTVFDLLYHLPFRYEDRSLVSPVAKVQAGETVTVVGTIGKIKNEYTHRGKFIQNAQFHDSSGSLPVTWFNQSFLTRTIPPESQIALFGKVDTFKGCLTLVSPEYEIISNPRQPLLHMTRIVPIYPETSGLTSKFLRLKIFQLISALEFTDFLPSDTNLLNWKTALESVHFPRHPSDPPEARQRLAFDELLILRLISLMRKKAWQSTKLTCPLTVDQEKISVFCSSFPFTLTPSQNRALAEILSDLGQPRPMNRLLEGDVGSGKTVVAAVAAYVSYFNGFRTLILAPTQILAQQHYRTLSALFRPLDIKIGLITGASGSKSADSEFRIIVGTHALISQNRQFSQVGLVVIDEQHRFGVIQRSLASQKGVAPHILTMTATPIPRTVALTLYGDLDLSILDAPPAGRLPIKTWVVPESKRESAYLWIAEQLNKTHSQAYIVCPFIEESESLTSVKAATAEFTRLQKIFPQFNLGLLHGRLKPGQKTEVMENFFAGRYQILVTTPVVEVGIDNPNAALMLIEDADRFGLSQLHQLRGRVGRSHIQSYCLLFSSRVTDRLRAMEKYSSGLKLAETDLELRGPGDLYGTAQHGTSILKIAGFSDPELISRAHEQANRIFPNLQKFPLLRSLLKQDKINLVQPN